MKFALSMLALALVFPVLAAAQSPTIAVGARVRVTAPSDNLKKHVATVTHVRGDSIAVAGRDGTRTIALANVTALDVSIGQRRRVLRNAGLGLAAGVVIGAVSGLLTHEECYKDTICPVPTTKGESVAAGAGMLGAVGLMAGAALGSLDRTDRWESVSVPARISVAPTARGGLAVSLSRSF